MASPEDHMDEKKDNVVLSLYAGSSLVKGRTLFSSDSEYLFCCSGMVVKVYNTANSQCVQQLRGHRDVVTGLALHPTNKLQLFSCGLDGIINQWDFTDGVLLKSHDLYMPLHALLGVDNKSHTVIVMTQRPLESSYSVLRQKLYSSRTSKVVAGSDAKTQDPVMHSKADILLPSCASDHRMVSFGCGGDCIVTVKDHKLSVYSFKKKSFLNSRHGQGNKIVVHQMIYTVLHVNHVPCGQVQIAIRDRKLLFALDIVAACLRHRGDKSNPFTCVACHPTEHCLATGHKNGKITLWWGFLSKAKLATSVRHWHALPVQTLAFTPEGSYLLSGGHECVLVKWQTNTEHRDFLPRLGTPLCNITCSPDGTLYATSHSDNVIQLITSNFHINYAIRGLARAHLGADISSVALPLGLIFDPRSKALVTNGRPGHLQFYCLRTDTQLFQLDIVGQNYVSPDNLDGPVPVTEVEQAAFDHKGHWLLTYERWDDGTMTPEYRLKFWFYNRKKQNYQLNTTVESPHKRPVVSVQFRPPVHNGMAHEHMAVTSSQDGTFKLWKLVNKSQINKTIEMWTCESLGFYRDHPAGVAKFSEDGSILAVAFGAALTLWDPDINVLKAVVSDPSHSELIRFVEFGGKSCSHLVVTATASHLTVWNLISLSVLWHVAAEVEVLVTDGDIVGAVSADRDLFIFRPNSWKPIYSQPCLTQHSLVSAIFIPITSTREADLQQDDGPLSWQNKSRLFLFDKQQHLLTLEYSSIDAEKRSPQSKVQLEQVLPETPFSTLLSSVGHQKDLSTPANKAAGKAWHPKSSVVERILQTPAHNLPHMHAICSEFIESLLQVNKSKGPDTEEKAEESMEVEDHE